MRNLALTTLKQSKMLKKRSMKMTRPASALRLWLEKSSRNSKPISWLKVLMTIGNHMMPLILFTKAFKWTGNKPISLTSSENCRES